MSYSNYLLSEPYVDEWKEENEIYYCNITFNLRQMGIECGLYDVMWNEENDGKQAHEIIEQLEKGYELLKSKPEHFKQFNSPNGWGTYKNYLPYVGNYLKACKENPNAYIEVCK